MPAIVPGMADRSRTEVPVVRLGRLAEGGLAPAILAIVERGVRRRPELAATVLAEVELRVDPGYPPVRVVFGADVVLVEDAPGRGARAPGARRAQRPDRTARRAGDRRGAAAVHSARAGRAGDGRLARGSGCEGDRSLLRRLMAVIRI